MKVAILGAGAMGLTTAAILADRGHQPVLWSPSGASTQGVTQVQASGALNGCWPVDVAASPADALEGAGAVFLVVDAAGHRPVMDRVAPLLKPGVPFVVSAAHSLSGLYLARILGDRAREIPILSFNTSPGTAHRHGPGVVDIRTVRARIEVSVMPAVLADQALEICRTLLPARFETRAEALSIALLSNCNPVFHVPVCLLNLNRIEAGEAWAPYGATSPAVGRLMEALDRERLAVAAAFGITIHSVNEHFHRSFRVPLGSMAQMNAVLFASGRGPKGPVSVEHRYLTQDIPFGIVFAAAVARVAGCPTPVHDGVIATANAALGRDFAAENTLLSALGLDSMTPEQLLELAAGGPAAMAQ